MSNFKVWISSFRLRTLPLSISGILIGSAFAFANEYFNITIFIFALLTTISLQILSNLANDYGDGVKGTDSNNRIGPERAIQSGLISPKQMKNAIIINIIILIILIIILLNNSFELSEYFKLLSFFLLGFISIYAAIKYTVGNNAYGYYALGDIFVLFFFGFLSTMGSYYLYSKSLDLILVLPSLCVGLLSVAVINLNNMRDLVSDKVSNKITIAGKLGFDNSKKYHYLILVSSIIFSLIFVLFFYYKPISIILAITYIPIVIHLRKVYLISKPKHYNEELKKVAISTFIFSLFLSLIIIM
ncbi:1,4-dihydroxy-2-naphthoate octaprenyltransferase [Flavobacteriaceae bacterium]|nr:1,4-dihydroxy-2-naphthoate octaprenyltransferase [Flavobacteriaceae bacterium]MDC1491947.1 1,4-dihydroxy-2-naphthoate octaprenyltransferase [Flavobacteriaceae bacterium]